LESAITIFVNVVFGIGLIAAGVYAAIFHFRTLSRIAGPLDEISSSLNQIRAHMTGSK